MFSFLLRPQANGGIGVAFTDRLDGFSPGGLGSLNLGRAELDSPQALRRNAAAVQAELGISRWVALDQVHGRRVHLVDEASRGACGPDSWIGPPVGEPALPVADAAVTALADTPLVIRVADCVPVLLADAAAGVVAGAHAGRAGFDSGVLECTVDEMRRLGATSVTAWIGPHICARCYEVGEQMAAEIGGRHRGVAARTSWGSASLDLGTGCQLQLEDLGVRVQRVDPCTRTSEQLHSYRRDGDAAGRLAGIIWRVSGEQGTPNPVVVR